MKRSSGAKVSDLHECTQSDQQTGPSSLSYPALLLLLVTAHSWVAGPSPAQNNNWTEFLGAKHTPTFEVLLLH